MDDDLARQLPDPPPPRPAARRAALDAAMARFDGVEAPAPPRRQPPARVGWRLRPGPVGALASIALAFAALIAAELLARRQGRGRHGV